MERQKSPTSISGAGSTGDHWFDENLTLKALEDKVVEEWEERQAARCMDPYLVLGATRDDIDDEVLDELLNKKIGKYIEEGHTKEGVGRIMVVRAQRVHSLLTDAVRRMTYDTQLKGRIEEGSYAILHFANGNYEGEVDPKTMAKGDALPEGVGMVVLVNGEKYEGEFHTGKKQGVGLQFWSNGDLYLGQWRSDKMSGHGCYMYGSGVQYYGEFVGGQRHGGGRLRWLDGSSYAGEFIEGVRAGHGKLTLPMNSDAQQTGKYEGQWKDNTMHGRGRLETLEEGNYEGQFKSNSFHGQGRLEFPNGDVHVGSFARGFREGKGRYEWKNGDWFEGNFRNSGRDGNGTFISKDRGIRFKGQFQEDMPHGRGTLLQETPMSNPMEYEGQFDHGLKSGMGKYIWPDNTEYRGQFAQDLKHGAGTLTWDDDSIFKGTFTEDKRHGVGVFVGAGSHAGEQMEHWEMGELVKQHSVHGAQTLVKQAGDGAAKENSKPEAEKTMQEKRWEFDNKQHHDMPMHSELGANADEL